MDDDSSLNIDFFLGERFASISRLSAADLAAAAAASRCVRSVSKRADTLSLSLFILTEYTTLP